jgi:hypothetical protein
VFGCDDGGAGNAAAGEAVVIVGLELFDPQVLVVDIADRAAVHAAVVEFGPLSAAEVAATTGVELDQVRRALRAFAVSLRASRGQAGWVSTGAPRRRERYRQGGDRSDLAAADE